MTRTIKQLIAVFIFAVAAAACATNGAPDDTQTVVSNADADGKKYRRECTYEKSTSSRIGTKTCRNVEITE